MYNHNKAQQSKNRVHIFYAPPQATNSLAFNDKVLWAAAPALKLWGNLQTVRVHYGDVIMGAISSQITSLTVVYSAVYSGADKKKHQSSASLAFVWGIHRGPVNSPHKWPVTRKMFPFDDVIMQTYYLPRWITWSLTSKIFLKLPLQVVVLINDLIKHTNIYFFFYHFSTDPY